MACWVLRLSYLSRDRLTLTARWERLYSIVMGRVSAYLSFAILWAAYIDRKNNVNGHNTSKHLVHEKNLKTLKFMKEFKNSLKFFLNLWNAKFHRYIVLMKHASWTIHVVINNIHENHWNIIWKLHDQDTRSCVSSQESCVAHKCVIYSNDQLTIFNPVSQ